jgi:hypothetical protein
VYIFILTVNKVRGEPNMEALIFAGNILIWWKSKRKLKRK